jgi:four helix bundle protein
MKIKNYRDLLAYQKSYQFALLIYRVTSGFPSTEMYGLVSQMRRAAVSVPSNISEGYRRGSQKEYTQFLKISLGSSSELETHLSLSRELGLIDGDEFKKVYELNEEVGRLLASYISRLAHRE